MLHTCVTYDGLPISSGGAHALGRVSARSAYAAWQHFLGACTEPTGVRAWFDFPQTPELDVDPAVRRLIEVAFQADATYPRRRVVPTDRFEDALALFESLEPLPTNPWGMAPVWLWFSTGFRLRSPDGTGLWPGQDTALFAGFQTPGGVDLGASSARLILQAKRSFGLMLSLPEATDEQLAEARPWLQAELPMKLSSKHWVRWTLNKNGRSYRGKRIAPPDT